MAAQRKTNRFGRKRYVRRRQYGARRPVYTRRMFRSYAPRPELKKKDFAKSDYNVNTTVTVVPINGIAQALTSTGRIGNKIQNKWFSLNGYVKHNNTATDGQMVKIWLIRDNQQRADIAITGADFLQEPANAVLSSLSADAPSKVKILATRSIMVDPSNEMKLVKIFKKLYFPTWFNGVNDTDYQKSMVYLVFASSDTTNKPVFSFTARHCYTDV